jgi:hypothetical protein
MDGLTQAVFMTIMSLFSICVLILLYFVLRLFYSVALMIIEQIESSKSQSKKAED